MDFTTSIIISSNYSCTATSTGTPSTPHSSEARRDPQPDQCPVTVRTQLREQRVQPLIRDAPWRQGHHLGSVPNAALPSEGLHRIVVPMPASSPALSRLRNQIDHRSRSRLQLEVKSRAARFRSGQSSPPRTGLRVRACRSPRSPICLSSQASLIGASSAVEVRTPRLPRDVTRSGDPLHHPHHI